MRLQKSRSVFLRRSRVPERIIRSQARTPDYIFHVYSMFASFAGKPWVPYAMWLDYTMSLAYRQYRPWAPFRTDQDRLAWLDWERQAYACAHDVFTTSEVVRRSVIEDYDVPPDHVTVVGELVMIHGLTPGPLLMTKNPDLFWGVITSMYIGNIMLLILNLPLIPLWVKLLQVPYSLLFPFILLFCLIGVYTINNNVFGIYLMTFFGVVGYLARKFEFEPAPFVCGGCPRPDDGEDVPSLPDYVPR